MTTLIARSPEWHADRLATIGASEAPIITGDAPWSDVLTLFAVKVGIIDPPAIENNRTAWGLRLETVVAEWFTETYGLRLRRDNTRPRHPQHPWMATSLDRRVVGESALVEIKTARFPTDEWGKEDTAEVPAHVLVQCQHEMACTGAALCYVAVLFSGSDPRRYIVPRDEPLIADLIELEAEFMECIRTGTPPDALIRRQRPVIALRDGEITADATLATGIEGVYNLRAEIKERKADLTAAEDAVKTLLGPNTAARAGAYRATYKPNADGVEVGWELIASAFRKRLAAVDPEFDAAAIESLFTIEKAGQRPLRITVAKEARDAA